LPGFFWGCAATLLIRNSVAHKAKHEQARDIIGTIRQQSVSFAASKVNGCLQTPSFYFESRRAYNDIYGKIKNSTSASRTKLGSEE